MRTWAQLVRTHPSTHITHLYNDDQNMYYQIPIFHDGTNWFDYLKSLKHHICTTHQQLSVPSLTLLDR
ncbi:uncharacterized protein MYCGRDRAFT_103811 [Zymoseptoria tritici IPO323]|uniref:Uncharacterized protein n=1 Tax=Zymoseptoria tritici (strain CBS 115943 / IPO323) TaxID=336722 RepID=F9X6Z4_ZYMTI|nr:uncharacterized protein MYCGRDRAFT_103811 [Zymoseptoria tritici IPO323]EGP89320.1 hypothetical protein MYCGRDRAFT_103811 [Zymoseptoria tritici IPO323]